MKFCPECGTRTVPGSLFCSECGFRLTLGPPAAGTLPANDVSSAMAGARQALSEGDLRSSLDQMDAILRDHMDDPRAWNNRALVLSKMGRYGEAVQSFDRALELDPDNPDILLGKGSALYGQEKYSTATEVLQRASELAPSDRRIGERLSQCRNSSASTAPGDLFDLGSVSSDGDPKACPSCSAPMRNWEGNWWCDSCRTYPLLSSNTQPADPGGSMSCSTCGGPLRMIEKYGRMWCNSCRKYEKRASGRNGGGGSGHSRTGGTGPCATCGGSLRFIRQYNRYWCDACQKYG